MNVNTLEAFAADPDFADRVANAAFYGTNRLYQPGFTASWAEVSGEDKAPYLELGLEILRQAFVDDYTTPGCKCSYCSWTPKSGRPRVIMCQQRWDGLPSELRLEITESCAD